MTQKNLKTSGHGLLPAIQNTKKAVAPLKNLGFLSILGLSLGLTCSASADSWTGLAGDGQWSNPLNWSGNVVPGNSGNVTLDPANGSSVMTIGAGQTQTPGLSDQYGMIYGPEWGATLNIYGALKTSWYLAPVQNNPAQPSTINMYGNSSYSSEGIGLGYNWWWNGGPYVTMNVNDSSTVNINYFFWGGHLNLNGGTFTTGAVNDGNSDQVSDATRMMNIGGGKLILPGDATATVNGWLARGILEAYGGSGQIVIDTTSINGKTIVSAVPEPTALSLLALCGLAGFCSRRRATA